jgi:hypothetical protein
MTSGVWTEAAVSERIATLRREAEHQRLIRTGRDGGAARRVGSGRWPGWVGRIRAARLRRQPRPLWRDPEFLARPGDRS